jgi:hypothetical protein
MIAQRYGNTFADRLREKVEDDECAEGRPKTQPLPRRR